MDIIGEVTDKVRPHFLDARGSHGWDHVERVCRMCVHIGRKENADLEILMLSALLHDIGRHNQDMNSGNASHAEDGSSSAREILEGFGYEKKKIEMVVHCIESHSFKGSKAPETKEAKILFDADKLDSIGAIGVGRDFLFAGEIGAKLHDKNVDIEKTRPYTADDTAYREFLVKLVKIKDAMFTEEGRRIAEGRHEFMVNFFDRLNKEVDGEL